MLEAMGVEAEHSLRLSVGWSTTDADITTFLTALPTVVEKLRAMRSPSRSGDDTPPKTA